MADEVLIHFKGGDPEALLEIEVGVFASLQSNVEIGSELTGHMCCLFKQSRTIARTSERCQ